MNMNNNMKLGMRASRRSFLRGLSSTLAIPTLASLGPWGSVSAATGRRVAVTESGAPLRTAFLYFPNGVVPEDWWPTQETTEFATTPSLSPLAEVRRHVQVMGELEHRNAEAGPDGAGDHARGNSVFLTGVRLKKSATDIRAGLSIDQIIAREVGHLTRMPSLELTCDAVRKSGSCDSGYACAYQYNLAWSSPTSPMTPEANPRLLFERLFGPGLHGTRADALRRRQLEQRSILDFVLEDARTMQARMDLRDRDKLDQYLTGIRDIEKRIAKAENFGVSADPLRETPEGIPTSHAEYTQLMFDMLVLAFQTDSTRVATMLLAHDGSNRSFSEIGVPEGHHDLSHHQNRPEMVRKVAQIDRWYVSQFAEFIRKLDSVTDIDGKTVLHNSMILYGSGNGDGNRHTHHNLPMLLAGGGGGTAKPGRYVRFGGKPACNLLLGMADRMGVTGLDRFGDSTGRLENI